MIILTGFEVIIDFWDSWKTNLFCMIVGDCGILVVYAEEQTGFKDKITFEFTGSNLDKKDLFSESDPFFTISRSVLKS